MTRLEAFKRPTFPSLGIDYFLLFLSFLTRYSLKAFKLCYLSYDCATKKFNFTNVTKFGSLSAISDKSIIQLRYGLVWSANFQFLFLEFSYFFPKFNSIFDFFRFLKECTV